MSTKTSIRMSGLGGQGVVTAAHILGNAASKDGLVSTVNPFFGAEKRLAPAESYVRIDSKNIHERGEVLFPDVIMIFHPHVITMGKCYTMPFFDGLRENGIILVNTDEEPQLSKDDQEKLAALNAELYYFSATQVALDVGGTELATNMAMLGGLLGVKPLVSPESLKVALMERFGGGKFVASGTTAALDDALQDKYEKISQLIEKNMQVMEAARSAVKKMDIQGGNSHVCCCQG
ncbi:MAG: 2-oxoacid:acceptor oxidoreductase family protein [Bacillota bacterium]|nr:2-oxoacid:acceptor oxidoreductase family protein [Bacillota bacterium]MDW7684268.1 2-oxoacid:acceptor oxidoreductase family protein [Bacillota bacterium]